jgi:hypothetical protein
MTLDFVSDELEISALGSASSGGPYFAEVLLLGSKPTRKWPPEKKQKRT